MRNDSLLRNALKANGLFSVLSALTAMLLGNSVLAINEMAGGEGLLFGLQLIVFAAFVFYNAFRPGVSKVMIIIIVVLDIIYVIGALASLFILFEETSGGGIALIVFSSLAVALFATFQWLGLKRVGDAVSATG